MLINNIEPQIPANRACDLFAERMPSDLDVYVATADSNPGRLSVVTPDGQVDDKKSFRAWANKYVSEAQKALLRAQSRDRRKTPAVRYCILGDSGSINFTGVLWF